MVSSCLALEIKWDVKQRFRLLSEAENILLQEDWKDLTRSDGQQTMQRLILAKMRNQQAREVPLIAIPESDVYDRAQDQGRYTRAYVDHLARPVKVNLAIPGTAGQSCEWSVPAPLVLEPGEKSADCTAAVKVPYDTTFNIKAQIAGSARPINVDVKVKDVLIAAFGDSYSSGEGNPDVPAQYSGETPPNNYWVFEDRGPPAQWWDEECHRSMLSWPVLAALKLSLLDPHNTVTLLNYSCSGAEVGDGILMAQIKQTLKARNQAYPRDGFVAGPNVLGDLNRYTRRSQANALREDLCGDQPLRIDRAVSIPGSHFLASLQTCDAPIRKPDFLVLTIGGNDIRFGPAVQGVLTPDKGQGKWSLEKWIRTFVLGRARSLMGIETVDGLGVNAEEQTKHYPDLMKLVSEAAWVPPSRTVLVRYPNPIGTSEEGVASCQTEAGHIHTRNSFMLFGVVAKKMSWMVPRGWTVWLGEDEISGFLKSFPKIERMQQSACGVGVRVVDAVPRTADPPFNNRLMCSSVTHEQREELEPRYFCQPKPCDPSQRSDCPNPPRTECDPAPQRKRIGDWQAYRPSLRMIYSMNDSVLAQRSWQCTDKDCTDLTMEKVLESISGTMHLSAEMHAAAADSATAEFTSRMATGSQICRKEQ
jgi:hypothetical protein